MIWFRPPRCLMVIRKGEPWGSSGDRPPDLTIAADDAAAAALVADGVNMLGLASGDMFTTVGGSAQVGEHQHLPLDICWVSIDDQPRRPCFAHVVARHRWWQGEAAVIMNAAWLGPLYLGPRAHPNDGLLDVTVGSLPVGQRLQARRRATSGTHLPHPGLTTSRTATWNHHFDRPIPVWIDGVLATRGRRISVEIEPDALLLVT